jgi:hypothetical protein
MTASQHLNQHHMVALLTVTSFFGHGLLMWRTTPSGVVLCTKR